MKIKNDKYYTPPALARELIVKTIRFVGVKNITDIIEPSAGSGAFSKHFKDCKAYDIEPEAEGIIKQDFLTLDLPYQKGRLIIGKSISMKRISVMRLYKYLLDNIEGIE